MLLTQKELCEKLKVSSVFLYKCRTKGMPYIRLSRGCIRYCYDDVLNWFRSEKVVL